MEKASIISPTFYLPAHLPHAYGLKLFLHRLHILHLLSHLKRKVGKLGEQPREMAGKASKHDKRRCVQSWHYRHTRHILSIDAFSHVAFAHHDIFILCVVVVVVLSVGHRLNSAGP